MFHSSFLCQSVCLGPKCIESLWCVAMFTLLMLCIDACVWVSGNLKRTYLSVMKCDRETLTMLCMEYIDQTYSELQQWLWQVEYDSWACP